MMVMLLCGRHLLTEEEVQVKTMVTGTALFHFSSLDLYLSPFSILFLGDWIWERR